MQMTRPTPAPSAGASPAPPASRAGTMLGLATVGFLLNFWAWALLSPLGASLRDDLGLTSLQQSLLVAVPVLVGSLGRIPVGALTDRFGARVMFPAVSAATILPVLFVGLLGDSYVRLLIGGFFLGVGGTAFAVGVPFVNAWSPRPAAAWPSACSASAPAARPCRRSRPSGSPTPTAERSPSWSSRRCWPRTPSSRGCSCRTRPGAPQPPPAGSWPGPGRRCGCRSLSALSALYALGFGGFVAFSVYLPVYLRNAYGLTPGDAATRTAGFVVLAVAMRPVGGWLSDRLRPVPVLTACFAAAAGLAALAAAELSLLPWATVAFLGLAAALGAASGAVFALARVVPADKVGSVTGVVGAAGGLGGFVPPLLMGAIYGRSGDYSLGYALLAATAAAAALYAWAALRNADRR